MNPPRDSKILVLLQDDNTRKHPQGRPLSAGQGQIYTKSTTCCANGVGGDLVDDLLNVPDTAALLGAQIRLKIGRSAWRRLLSRA